jgi:acyl-ACP thioesterase
MNSEIPRVLQKNFTVRSFDVGISSALTIFSLCRYLQEIAGLHAQLLNVSTEQLHDAGKTWVLREMAVEADLSPRWRDRISIVTWPTTRSSGVRAYRDFQIFDQADNLLGVASSMWLMLDRQSFKPLKIPESILAYGGPPIMPDPLSDLDLAEFDRHDVEIAKPFAVRLSDLDINQHVNNVSYVQLALEAISEERFKNCRLTKFQIKYLMEAKLGDTILSESRAKENVVEHQLRIESEARVAALMRSEWRRDKL